MLLNRRQFVKAATGLMAALALPLPDMVAEEVSEDIVWGAPEPAWQVVEFTRERYDFPLYGHVDGEYKEIAKLAGVGTCRLTVQRTWNGYLERQTYLFDEEEIQGVLAAESWSEMEARLLAKLDKRHMANRSSQRMPA
jgi:hypothetical protein